MENAVKGFEMPGMNPGSIGRDLEGAFMIPAQEDAGCAPIMVWAFKYCAVNGLFAGQKWIRLLPAIEPGVWVMMGGWHVLSDVGGIILYTPGFI